MAGKITIEELAESTKEALQTDLTPIENKIQEVLAAAQAIEVKLQGEEALKQQLVNSLTALGFEVSMENELSELFEIVNGIKMGQGNAQPEDVVEGKTFTNDSGEMLTGTLKKATGNAAAAQVLTGYTFSNASGVGLSGSMANNGAKTFTPSASKQTSGAGYYSGITCNAVSGLVASSIISGKTIGGVAGTATVATLGGKRYYSGTYQFTYAVTSSTAVITAPFSPKTVIMFMKDDRYLCYHFLCNGQSMKGAFQTPGQYGNITVSGNTVTIPAFMTQATNNKVYTMSYYMYE